MNRFRRIALRGWRSAISIATFGYFPYIEIAETSTGTVYGVAAFGYVFGINESGTVLGVNVTGVIWGVNENGQVVGIDVAGNVYGVLSDGTVFGMRSNGDVGQWVRRAVAQSLSH